MSDQGDTMSVEEAANYAADTAKLADVVAALEKSQGWRVFMALFKQREREIKDRSDYASLEDFKADRRAIEIVHDIIGEFSKFSDDATSANDLLTKLTQAETQTPDAMLLGGEDGIEG